MREIKFRTWSEGLKQYIGYWGVYQDNGTKSFQTGPPTGAGKPYIHEQYTGLKDKNGREVYEGDVVRIFMNHIADIAPEWVDKEYILQVWFDTDTACFKIYDMTLEYGMLKNQFGKLEVIGNIHENPELLEDK